MSTLITFGYKFTKSRSPISIQIEFVGKYMHTEVFSFIAS